MGEMTRVMSVEVVTEVRGGSGVVCGAGHRETRRSTPIAR
jgi:hypothetical protein